MPTEGLTGGKKGLRVKSYEIVPDHLLLGLASHTYPLACIVVLHMIWEQCMIIMTKKSGNLTFLVTTHYFLIS